MIFTIPIFILIALLLFNRFPAIMLIMTLTTPALALTDSPPLEIDCATDNSQAALNYCAKETFDLADQRLNQIYQQQLINLEQMPKQREKMVAAQQAWLKYRELDCDFQRAQFEGGSIAPLIDYRCRLHHTETRIEVLQNLPPY